MQLPCQCNSDDSTLVPARRAAGLLSLVLAMASAQVMAAEQGQGQVPAQPGAQQQTLAAFKQKDIDFYYRSSLAPFSCHDIANRVAVIMNAIGARDDVNVSVTGCETVVTPSRHRSRTSSSDPWGGPSSPGTFGGSNSSGGGWSASVSADPFDNSTNGGEQSARVHIRAMMPVVVTPEVLNEMEKDKSRRELISRVTGNPAARMDVPVVFPASKQQVTLSHRTIKLEPEDCELLEQMSRSIFRSLGVRTVGGGPNCDRREMSHMAPQMTVEALLPVAPPAGPKIEIGKDAPAAPASGSSEPPAATPPEQPPQQQPQQQQPQQQ